jgi:hypothetical protein
MRVRPWAPVAALVTGAVGLVGSAARGGTVEEPAYTVESSHDGWEIRRYPPTIEARVTVGGPYDAALGAGFRLLAGYIFGDNTTRASIAMTAPVAATRLGGQPIARTAPVAATAVDDESWTIAFTMPAEWSLDALPAPNDPRVSLVAVPGGRIAARPFGGWATAGRVADHEDALLVALRAQGLDGGPPTVAHYDPPWTPPPFRRNEILVPLPDATP